MGAATAFAETLPGGDLNGAVPARQRASQFALVVAVDCTDIGLAVDSVSDIADAASEDFAEPPTRSRKISTMVRQNDHLISILYLDTLL
jgi:chemotaxis signal transduction protein